MSKYIIDTETWANLFEVQRVGVYGIGNDIVTDEKTVWSRMFSLDELEELNSDYINENFGELQDEAYKQGYAEAERIWRAPSSYNEFYQKGLEDAWEAARRIVVDTDHGGLALGTLSGIFGTQSYSYIMRENTAQEAIDKIKAYEDGKHSDRIEVGDEVRAEEGHVFVVTGITDKGSIYGFDKDGMWLVRVKDRLRKTGKHYDIASILEAMRTHD